MRSAIAVAIVASAFLAGCDLQASSDFLRGKAVMTCPNGVLVTTVPGTGRYMAVTRGNVAANILPGITPQQFCGAQR